MRSLYPFTIYAGDRWNSAGQSLAAAIWMRDRGRVAPNLAWYAVDLEVLGRDDVTLYVRGMRDNVHGGIGEVIHIHRPKLEADELAELGKIIKSRQTEFAADEYHRREQRRIELVVEGIRREMFGED